DRLDDVRKAGFEVKTESSRARVLRKGFAAVLQEVDGGPALVGKAGVMVGDEVGVLIDGGYQKFFQTPSGRRIPALAEHLKELHNFQEDLREALGLVSLYNQGLGTTFDRHMYDRVQGRDAVAIKGGGSH
ncbi:MAG TPA: hypothetical protein VEX68_12775, partial [Bryobacteraceae bacterium]|nr:hypothetical protein [Bryobacteraceae bacterium]